MLFKKSGLVLFLFVQSHYVLAENAIPNAGSILNQISPEIQLAPSELNKLEFKEKAVVSTDSTKVEIKTIDIVDSSVFSKETLHELVKGQEGKLLTFNDIQNIAILITDYYRQKGYPLSRAIIPEQDISSGLLTVQVVEGFLDNVYLNNSSRVKDGLIKDTLSHIQLGNTFRQDTVDAALLLVQDIPNINATTTLKAGDKAGATDLYLDVNSKDMIDGKVFVDGYGNKRLNRIRFGVNLNVYNPIGYGDVIGFSALTTGEKMRYGGLNYSAILNGYGTKFDIGYTSLQYFLGGDLSELGAHGNANTFNTGLSHPIIRKDQYNLYSSLQYEHQILKDYIDLAEIKNKRTIDTVNFGLSGNLRDTFMAGGINNFSLSYTYGNNHIKDDNAELRDKLTANTQGDFNRINFTLSRLQALPYNSQLWLSMNGQLTNENLDSSQKMVLGGAYSVRAYDMGAISGDSAYLMTAELRKLIFADNDFTLQGVAFIDTGRVKVNENLWKKSTSDNFVSLSGVGAGFNWSIKNKLSGRVYAATSIGSVNSLVKEADNTIVWADVNFNF